MRVWRSDLLLSLGVALLAMSGCTQGAPEVQSSDASETHPVIPQWIPPPPPPPRTQPKPFDPSRSDARRWLELDWPDVRGATGAKGAVEGLYRTHLRLRAGGIPRGDDIVAYRHWLSHRLRSGLSAAALERDRWVALAPDDKPPFVDGDFFSGMAEGITDFRVGRGIAIGQDAVRFPIALRYRDQSDSIAWTVDVVVIRENERWVVEDVKFDVDQPVERQSSLLDDLAHGTSATGDGALAAH